VPVHLRSNRCGVIAALTVAAALAGCASPDVELNQPWFRKPLDLFGQTGGYQYSDLQESSRRERPVTPNDLVGSNGACAAQAQVPQAQVAGPDAAASANPAASAGGSMGLGMTECEVVSQAGQPNSVQIGKNPNGDRTAVLTYHSGPRPGIYRFERGRLMEMDSVAPQPDNAKHPVRAKKARKQNNQA
jgi:hypothetical protein